MCKPSKQAIAHAFSSKAATYEEFAHWQKESVDHIINFLGYLHPARGTWLDVGCGIGLLEKSLPREHQPERIICSDIAAHTLQHIALLKMPCTLCSLRMDVDFLPFRRPSFDVVIAASVLQWSIDLAAAVEGLASLIAPNGYLIFCVLGDQYLQELRETRRHFGVQDPVSFASVKKISAVLGHSGLRLIASRHIKKTKRFASPLALLKNLTAIGATALGNQPARIRSIPAFSRKYRELFGDATSIPATLDMIVGFAQKQACFSPSTR
ncbi:MAG: methyltransferase domain-containing protein [Chitinivibrionales bacterium]|nr:methyltransferase domain-containing protein [Chitinivibrionales bacterium]